jgi:hypothetical protein
MKSGVRLSGAVLISGVALGVLLSGQQLPSEPARAFGASITGAFEGWFQNDDGSFSFLVGYLNRNRGQDVDVPVGPNNRIEPGGPDLGQPTHFLRGRHVGMFVVTVPKEFTNQQRLTWTLTVNGQTTTIPLRLNKDYNVSPFRISHSKTFTNTPPTIRFEENGPTIRGPIATGTAPSVTKTTAASSPLTLTVWMDDDAMYSSGTGAPLRSQAAPVRLFVSKYRGPGPVTFDKDRPEVEKLVGGNVGEPFRGKAAVTAKFSQPGDYLLHVTVNDYSGDGGGGEVCCWTTAIVKVTVTP